MAYITLVLISISVISLASLYIGIWGGVMDSFSDEKIRNELLIASRLTQYDEARTPQETASPLSPLSFFKQSEKLSYRQREVFKELLRKTNKELFAKLLLLFALIAWGSIYISHKIAGPLYRFHVTLQEMEQGRFSTRVHLRKNDEAQFLAQQFNDTIVSIDQTFSQIKNILRENEKNPERLTTRLKEELAKIQTSVDK
ncbi:MAG: hypothetical protein H6757_03390 [Candidatus Omnitrophica bacterium]|nr:hypothetical protein [Candidatus Omnitrophota bacterium]